MSPDTWAKPALAFEEYFQTPGIRAPGRIRAATEGRVSAGARLHGGIRALRTSLRWSLAAAAGLLIAFIAVIPSGPPD
jgi:hypothetical protein